MNQSDLCSINLHKENSQEIQVEGVYDLESHVESKNFRIPVFLFSTGNYMYDWMI